MIALMLTIELLSFSPQSSRATQYLHALHQAAPGRVQMTTTYRGESDLLVLWGPGALDRAEPMRRQLAAGGHVLALDLPYWDRFRKFRVAIDAAHPRQWVMRRDWPSDRLRADGIVPVNRWNPTGPIVVAGIGAKARVQYGQAVEVWQREMIADAARRWPSRPRLYRRKKPTDGGVPAGTQAASDAPIEQVLDGASLVITWHSNVAIDAMRLGIPVICKDGAAAAVYPSTFEVLDPLPLAEPIRDRFLANLAWFQWAPSEAPAFWRWVPEVLA